MKTLVLGVLLLGAGCGVVGLQSVDAPKVYVGAAVPVDAVAKALAMWNDSVGTGLAITGDPRISDVTVVSVSDDCGNAADGHQYLGYDDEGTTEAAVCMGNFPDQSDPLLVNTIAHELGHVMGMHHLNEDALMNKQVEPGSAITAADVAQFRARWGR